jgi:excisionase family DNA binding protein
VNDRPADLIERAVADALTATLPGVVDRLAELGGPRAYSVAQVAQRLHVSTQTVYRLVRAGTLATVPHLSPPRIAASTLEDFMRGRNGDGVPR